MSINVKKNENEKMKRATNRARDVHEAFKHFY